MKKYIVFHIEGGIGKNIMATAVVKAIKKQHPDNLPLMKILKKGIDPSNIMNPGKIFDLK